MVVGVQYADDLCWNLEAILNRDILALDSINSMCTGGDVH